MKNFVFVWLLLFPMVSFGNGPQAPDRLQEVRNEVVRLILNARRTFPDWSTNPEYSTTITQGTAALENRMIALYQSPSSDEQDQIRRSLRANIRELISLPTEAAVREGAQRIVMLDEIAAAQARPTTPTAPTEPTAPTAPTAPTEQTSPSTLAASNQEGVADIYANYNPATCEWVADLPRRIHSLPGCGSGPNNVRQACVGYVICDATNASIGKFVRTASCSPEHCGNSSQDAVACVRDRGYSSRNPRNATGNKAVSERLKQLIEVNPR
jgi:hypothetical protein